MNELPKSYDPSQVEDQIYQKWLSSGYFNPDNLPLEKTAPKFSIVLPPPNVTGTLHMGHAYEDTVQDILVRFKRMQGFRTLWVPGTDHAAIATQAKVEKDIYKQEEKTRYDLGREELVKRIEKFAQESHDTIVNQIKKMGASVDWTREAYTADTTRIRAVKTAFKRLYELGVIYQGSRIVNWDPKLQTTVSDDEIEWQEETTPFYYLKYGPFTIGTARPETKFGDKYVVMHPKDDHYKAWTTGDKVEVDWINGKVTATIIKDDCIDMEFGTGVMTITPWHDATDFEIAQRHGLDFEQIIDDKGKLLPIAGEFAGIHIKKARTLLVEKLQNLGLVEKVEENYTHRIATNSRGSGTIEPQIKTQWFVDVNREFNLAHSEITGIESGEIVTLKKLMRHVVESGQIKILPERFEKTYFHWIDNLRDWCISRQIWFGHRIPVWHDSEGKHHLPKEQKVFLARHAECEDNAQNIMARADSPLSAIGKDQVKALADQMRDKHITKIIASPLLRAQETAKLVALEIGLSETEIETWEELTEIHIGELVGQPEKPDLHGFAEAQQLNTGESLDSIEARAKKLIEKLETLNTSGAVLAIGHGGINVIVEAVLQGRRKQDFVDFRTVRGQIPNASWQEIVVIQDPSEANLHQDEDTLDTWFSSGLWTFSTLGWPNTTQDLQSFMPTDLMIPGYELIFFWVARMILMTTSLTGQIPFRTVVFHGMVRDKQGRKFSKSLNNGVDPLEMIEKYGTDALRFALVFGSGPGSDVAFDEQRIKGMKHFANKFWNIARFIITNLENSKQEAVNNQEAKNPKLEKSKSHPPAGGPNLKSENDSGLETSDSQYSHLWGRPEPITDADRDILAKLDLTITEATEHLENYRLHEAAQSIYQFAWYELADKYIEACKNQLQNQETKATTEKMLFHNLITVLKLLHPLMPFITEHIANILAEKGMRLYKDPLIISAWPKV
jgi:valyl-tRNA synthetase